MIRKGNPYPENRGCNFADAVEPQIAERFKRCSKKKAGLLEYVKAAIEGIAFGMGGERLYVGVQEKQFMDERHRSIYDARQSGCSLREIALNFKLSERQVQRIIRQQKEKIAQERAPKERRPHAAR